MRKSSSDSPVHACGLPRFRTAEHSRLQLPPGQQSSDQFDLLVGEGTHFLRVKAKTPIGTPSRNIGTADELCESHQIRAWRKRVFGISLDVGNVNDPAFHQRSPADRASLRIAPVFLQIAPKAREGYP